MRSEKRRRDLRRTRKRLCLDKILNDADDFGGCADVRQVAGGLNEFEPAACNVPMQVFGHRKRDGNVLPGLYQQRGFIQLRQILAVIRLENCA